MAHPQPKRRVQLSNDAKHLHAFHFEGHESYHLEGDASFDTDKMKAKLLPSQRTPQPKQYTKYDGHGRLIKTITPPRRASVHRQLPPLRR